MKKCSVILIYALILTLFCGCTNGIDNNKPKERIKVGVTMCSEFDVFTESIRHNIEDNLIKSQEETGVEIITKVVYANKDQLLQNEQVQDFIDKGYDVICVNLVDRTDASVIIDAAKAADIPIIFFNRELVEDDLNRFDKLYYVGAIPEESGRIQGDIVLDAWAERSDELDLNHDGIIQYVLLEGEPGHQDAIVRSRVSVERIQKGGVRVERLGDEIANWDRQQAHTKMTSILQGYPRQIELILCNDDNIALGAVDALKDFGVKSMPLIVGVNGQDEVLEMIDKGYIEGTVMNDSEEKGRIIARLAVGLGTEGTVPSDINLKDGKYIYVPYTRIDKKNCLNYYEKDELDYHQ